MFYFFCRFNKLVIGEKNILFSFMVLNKIIETKIIFIKFLKLNNKYKILYSYFSRLLLFNSKLNKDYLNQNFNKNKKNFYKKSTKKNIYKLY